MLLHFFGISASAGLLLASSGLRRQLPSLAETYVCLGKASSSSPVTFLLCLGPDIPGSSSTTVIRPLFRALFDPNVIQSQSASVELWFMGQGYEDHLVTPEDAIPDVDKQDMDLSTYIDQIASLKEEFLTLMPFTNGVEAQQIQTDKFFMVLTLIGLRPDLESVRDQILASPSVPSLDDVFARLLRLSSTQTLSTDVTWTPSRTAHIAQSFDPLLSRPDSTASSTSQSITLTGSDYDAYLRYQATTSASVAFVAQTGNVFVCFTQSPSLGPWIIDSGASDHISGNKNIFSSITTTSTLPTVTLANGSQTMAKGIGLAHPLPFLPFHFVLYARPEYGEDNWHRARLGHPSLSKFQNMVSRFSTLSSLACESCHLGKHTRVLFPKRLNHRAKSPFELVHTDVWGPCRTASTLGFQYFVTFIDDYSRLTILVKNF
ncbi:hypothetical protein CK203_026795 [Vitis vinifera]|uniref:GAG-pre-integrase domain-containing protein n=1 Tax=Vitis vinifera TaxID=29760 RepID=A0A438INW9_VITVI|nr:hypothetical protein CK203_026795 [Vitis vinifera]